MYKYSLDYLVVILVILFPFIEVLNYVSGQITNITYIFIYLFFIISGYFFSNSLNKSKNAFGLLVKYSIVFVLVLYIKTRVSGEGTDFKVILDMMFGLDLNSIYSLYLIKVLALFKIFYVLITQFKELKFRHFLMIIIIILVTIINFDPSNSSNWLVIISFFCSFLTGYFHNKYSLIVQIPIILISFFILVPVSIFGGTLILFMPIFIYIVAILVFILFYRLDLKKHRILKLKSITIHILYVIPFILTTFTFTYPLLVVPLLGLFISYLIQTLIEEFL